MCPRCRARRVTDRSHRAPRSIAPDLRGDPANRDDLCHGCHMWAENNPAAAEKEGWRVRRDTSYELRNTDPMAKVVRQTDRKQSAGRRRRKKARRLGPVDPMDKIRRQLEAE